jgi:hypothetical protein
LDKVRKKKEKKKERVLTSVFYRYPLSAVSTGLCCLIGIFQDVAYDDAFGPTDYFTLISILCLLVGGVLPLLLENKRPAPQIPRRDAFKAYTSMWFATILSLFNGMLSLFLLSSIVYMVRLV